MKKALLLFAALLVAGCGERSSSEDSDSTGESAEASPEAVQQSEEPLTLPLSDADVERLLKEAVPKYSLRERHSGGKIFFFQVNKSKPYTGWTKKVYDSGQAKMLEMVKDGRRDGPHLAWYESGQKMFEGTYKKGKKVSAKYWNIKGEEVETLDEAQGYTR